MRWFWSCPVRCFAHRKQPQKERRGSVRQITAAACIAPGVDPSCTPLRCADASYRMNAVSHEKVPDSFSSTRLWWWCGDKTKFRYLSFLRRVGGWRGPISEPFPTVGKELAEIPPEKVSGRSTHQTAPRWPLPYLRMYDGISSRRPAHENL